MSRHKTIAERKPKTIAERMDEELLIHLSDGSKVRQGELIDQLDFYKWAFGQLNDSTQEYLKRQYDKFQENR